MKHFPSSKNQRAMDERMAKLCKEKYTMRHIEVIFDSGNKLETSINGTDEEIREYYLGRDYAGRQFNLGDGAGGDLMAKAIAVRFITSLVG